MNDDILEALMDYTPDEIFHATENYGTMLSVMEMTPDDLMHHGIKGQKWGIRRFQPYRQGMKVAGGKVVGAAKKVKQRFKDAVETHKAKRIAKTEAKAAKAQAKAEAQAAKSEADKQRVLKTGTAEEILKYKGDLTPQEYSEAFLRLQNEKKLTDMVEGNKQTLFDKIDKGMAVVEKVGKYASIAANAKDSFDKLDKALNGDKEEDEKKKKENAKNAALTQIENITDLDRIQKEHKLTADEYSKGLKILQSKAAGKKAYDDGTFENQDRAKEKPMDAEYRTVDNVRKNAAYDNSNPEDFKQPARTLREKAAYKNPDGEPGYTKSTSSTPDYVKNYQGTPDASVIPTNSLSAPPTTPLKAAETTVLKNSTTVLSAVETTTLDSGKQYTDSLRNRSWESLSKEEKKTLMEDSQRQWE